MGRSGRAAIPDDAFALEPEDSLPFEAHLPHCWRNGQDSPSRLLLVLQATEGQAVALRRHIDSVGHRRRRTREGEAGRWPTARLARSTAATGATVERSASDNGSADA